MLIVDDHCFFLTTFWVLVIAAMTLASPDLLSTFVSILFCFVAGTFLGYGAFSDFSAWEAFRAATLAI